MEGQHSDTPGLAMVCDFDGMVTDVPWDDLGFAEDATRLSHFACLLDPGSVQKGLALKWARTR